MVNLGKILSVGLNMKRMLLNRLKSSWDYWRDPEVLLVIRLTVGLALLLMALLGTAIYTFQ